MNQDIQSKILTALKGRTISIVLLNGDTIEGKLANYDIYTIVVDDYLIYKHAISSITPSAKFRAKEVK